MAQFDEYEEESHAQRMRRKVKENPYVPIGKSSFCDWQVLYQCEPHNWSYIFIFNFMVIREIQLNRELLDKNSSILAQLGKLGKPNLAQITDEQPVKTLLYFLLANLEKNGKLLLLFVTRSHWVSLGLAGCLGAVAYGVIQFKNRGAMSPSVYVMKFRVIAQGAVVCMLGLGAGMTIINEHLLPKMRSMQNEADKKEWFAKNSTS